VILLKKVPAFLGLMVLVSSAWSTPIDTGYQQPPEEVIDLVDMAPPVDVMVAPHGQTLLLMERPALPPLSDLAAPEKRLAGLRFNPDNLGPSVPRYHSVLSLLDVDGRTREISGLPDPLKVLDAAWSPDGQHVAMLQIGEQSIELWRIDVAAAHAERWSDVPVHAAWGRGWGMALRSFIEWSPDSHSVVFRSLPAGRGDKPLRDPLPAGPVVTETRGRTAPTRTFQDLLGDTHDERLFEYYFMTTLVRLDLDGNLTVLGESGLIPEFSLSPDGHHVLVMRIQRPYSYAVPFARFAHRVEVWSRDGQYQSTIADNRLADDLPIAFDAVIDGRRAVNWRADADATLVWAQAADGGDPANDAEVRDRLFQQAAPFEDEPELLLESALRVAWAMSGDGDTALVWERWWATRAERVSRIHPDRSAQDPQLLWERMFEDRYNDPGLPMTMIDERGQQRLALRNGTLLLSGQGASDQGDRPFVDRLDLATGEPERLWQSEAPYFEQPLALLNIDRGRILTRRESVNEPPDFYRLDLDQTESIALTQTEHPLPEMKGIHRELIAYQRDDGVTLSANLLLPAGYDPDRDGPLPTMIWAYPREFISADAAGQVTDSPYRFNRLSYWSAQFLVTQGYAVLDNATMPVIGDEDTEPNDRLIEELTLNARAAIAAGVGRGVTDPERVAIGGHSYGAFMTASLLAHTDLFRAGIARSGAYNRTLTPFGFQREQRTLWDDADLYVSVSPFFHAHNMNTPVLIIHGAEDNNSGTYPMQSERLYQAIRGLGGTARLIMLPLESHGYRARESVLHMLYETINWLNEHVKGAEPRGD
jgi:dipeptidyl aminopeptidase/acylaminoacyl peptidase